MSKVVFASICAAALLSCAPPPQTPPSDAAAEVQREAGSRGLIPPMLQATPPLSTDELRTLLVGNAIVAGHLSHTYCPDGMLHVSGTRAPYSLNYTIADNRVCTDRGTCFAVYRMNGVLLAQALGPEAPIALYEVAVETARCGPQ